MKVFTIIASLFLGASVTLAALTHAHKNNNHEYDVSYLPAYLHSYTLHTKPQSNNLCPYRCACLDAPTRKEARLRSKNASRIPAVVETGLMDNGTKTTTTTTATTRTVRIHTASKRSPRMIKSNEMMITTTTGTMAKSSPMVVKDRDGRPMSS